MLATLVSVNSANRIRQKLKQTLSAECRIIQTPSSLAKEGCGYSLRFDDNYKDDVARAAKELRINIRAFYREIYADGTVQYIKE